jgi:hypothetical protein
MVGARNKYPNTRIFSTKIDFKAAFHHLHLHHSTTVPCCTQIPDLSLALMALHLTFGGTSSLFEWCTISESICDLATAILLHEDWHQKELHTPDQANFPQPYFLILLSVKGKN